MVWCIIGQRDAMEPPLLKRECLSLKQLLCWRNKYSINPQIVVSATPCKLERQAHAQNIYQIQSKIPMDSYTEAKKVDFTEVENRIVINSG